LARCKLFINLANILKHDRPRERLNAAFGLERKSIAKFAIRDNGADRVTQLLRARQTYGMITLIAAAPSAN
jgi:hypothetical protein